MNLDNIFLGLDKEIYIEELISWLNARKENYSTIKPTLKDGEIVIELVVMKEVKKPQLTQAQLEKAKKEAFKRSINKDKEIKK
jgi:hypothetical protein